MTFVPFTGARRILLLCDKLLPASPAPTAPLPPVRRPDATLSAEWLHALFGSLSAAITTSQAQAAAEAGVKLEPVTVEVVPPEPAASSATVAAPSGAFSCLGDSCVDGRAPCSNGAGAAHSADPNESVCAAAQRDPTATAMAKSVARLLQAQVLHYGVVRGAATSVGSSGGTGTGARPPLTVCVIGTSLSHLTALQHVSRSSGKSIFTILIDPRASANAAMRFECASKYGVQMVTHVPGDAATAIGQVLACYGRIQIGAPGPRHPAGEHLVECPYCPMHDLTPDQLWLHMPLYHITDTRNDPAVCPICRVHSEREPLARHVHNEHAPTGVHVEKTRCVPLYSYGLCVIRRPRDGRYLVVQEFSGSGFWLPGGSIDPGEVPWQAAARECLEEAGVRVRLTGLLRVEAQPHKGYARMRFIFFGEPEDPDADAKTLPDHESAGACWVSLKELTERGGVRLRGPEPLEWFRYIDAGGTIHPISIMGHEGDPPPPVVRPAALGAENGMDEDFVM